MRAVKYTSRDYQIPGTFSISAILDLSEAIHAEAIRARHRIAIYYPEFYMEYI